MPSTALKRYQNTTLRMPRHIYESAKKVIGRSGESSMNEFVVQAIEEKLQRLTEEEIDLSFAEMANDRDYQQASVKMAREFERSDWEALKVTETEQSGKGQTVDMSRETRVSPSPMESKRNVRSSKARPR